MPKKTTTFQKQAQKSHDIFLRDIRERKYSKWKWQHCTNTAQATLTTIGLEAMVSFMYIFYRKENATRKVQCVFLSNVSSKADYTAINEVRLLFSKTVPRHKNCWNAAQTSLCVQSTSAQKRLSDLSWVWDHFFWRCLSNLSTSAHKTHLLFQMA